MKSVIFIIVGLLVGISLIGAGVYYLLKERGDKDSLKIYGTFAAVGTVITIGMVIKIIVAGF
jgi:hypothetical protein